MGEYLSGKDETTEYSFFCSDISHATHAPTFPTFTAVSPEDIVPQHETQHFTIGRRTADRLTVCTATPDRSAGVARPSEFPRRQPAGGLPKRPVSRQL